MLKPIPCPRESDFICLGWGRGGPGIRIFFLKTSFLVQAGLTAFDIYDVNCHHVISTTGERRNPRLGELM